MDNQNNEEDSDKIISHLLDHVFFASNAFYFLAYTFFNRRDYEKYPHPECSPSHVFEHLVFHSVRDGLILSLSRLMDKPKTSGQDNASFQYLIKALQSKVFTENELTGRIQAKRLNFDFNPNAEDFDAERVVIQKTIQSANDEYVEMLKTFEDLKIWRHKSISHAGIEYAFSKKKLPALQLDDLEKFLNRTIGLANTISGLLKQTTLGVRPEDGIGAAEQLLRPNKLEWVSRCIAFYMHDHPDVDRELLVQHLSQYAFNPDLTPGTLAHTAVAYFQHRYGSKREHPLRHAEDGVPPPPRGGEGTRSRRLR